jgi:hypothetical protein
MNAINRVAWAVPPGAKTNTRPAKLVNELRHLGALDQDARYFFHGRSASVANSASVGVWRPFSKNVSDSGRSKLALLSPVFGARAVQEAAWVDFYDDWSLAPDINPWHRTIAANAYRSARTSQATVTANSIYMALKTGAPLAHVVPNGVDESIARYPRSGDDKRRLIVLGHFFRGRTDFDIFRAVLASQTFDEVYIGGVGTDKTMVSMLAGIADEHPGLLNVVEWLDEAAIASLAGQQTVALLPNVVSDYTLSQDMMKIYTFMALGIPVICPRALWPNHLAPDYALLYDFGVNLVDVLPEWIEESNPSDSWRIDFARSNSWRERAHTIMRIMGDARA